jgi:hypothetical protein
MSRREKLPNRRRSELREIRHNGQAYTLCASYFPDSHRVAEIFLHTASEASPKQLLSTARSWLLSRSSTESISRRSPTLSSAPTMAPRRPRSAPRSIC